MPAVQAPRYIMMPPTCVDCLDCLGLGEYPQESGVGTWIDPRAPVPECGSYAQVVNSAKRWYIGTCRICFKRPKSVLLHGDVSKCPCVQERFSFVTHPAVDQSQNSAVLKGVPTTSNAQSCCKAVFAGLPAPPG